MAKPKVCILKADGTNCEIETAQDTVEPVVPVRDQPHGEVPPAEGVERRKRAIEQSEATRRGKLLVDPVEERIQRIPLAVHPREGPPQNLPPHPPSLLR